MQMGNNRQVEGSNINRNGKGLVVTVVSAIILGAIGSGIWEIMFKPGLSSLGAFFSNMSVDFNNNIFASAALNPQPLPGLILILLFCTIPLFFCSLFLFKGFVQIPLENFFDAHFDYRHSTEKLYQAQEKRFLRLRQLICVVGILTSMFFAMIALKGFALQNEATYVWRVFHKNLEICAPFTSDLEIKKINAHFRSMKNKSDYRSIKYELNKIASESEFFLEW